MIRISTLIFTVLILSGLSACGFRPLYGEQINTPAIAQNLERIDVVGIRSLNGVKLRNELLDNLQPTGQGGAALHRLAYKLTEFKTGVGTRIDASATRYNYRMIAAYDLTDIKTGQSVLSGRSVANVAYDVNNSQFATVISRQDAQERALKEISADIKLRLALFFEQQNSETQAAFLN